MKPMITTQFTTFWPANIDSSTPQMVWDSFKAVIRGEYVSAIRAARMSQNSDIQRLQDVELACAADHATAPTLETLQSLQQARRELNLHYCNQKQCMARKQAETLFDAGDKNGKLLAMLTADTYMPTVVPCVYGADDVLRSSAEEVLQTFVDFYKSLYSPIPSYDNTALLGFLGRLNLAVLPNDARLLLDAPFTGEEVASAIGSFPNGKSPGPDGLPVE